MLIILFILLLLSVICIWRGARRRAMLFYMLSILLSTITFIHHITDTIGLSL
jgi:hypothetical protein